jgi:ABC-type transport system involved in cytochrome bd biosynthesis fused ATPase/permease subunit
MTISDEMSFKNGDRILITGPSSAGKSTFIDALTGMIIGMTLKDAIDPRSIHHHFVKFYQNIKETVRTSKTTTRDLFKNEMNDAVIYQFLRIVDMEDWVKKLTEPKKYKKNYPDWTVFGFLFNWLTKLPYIPFMISLYDKWFKSEIKKNDDIEMGLDDPHVPNNNLDIEINERHSGGQKTRLVLATKLYRLYKSNAAGLILDEPEQGTDPWMAYEIIKRIHTSLPDKLIIIISHLEKIGEFDWFNVKLRVNNGIVSYDC